MSAAKFKEARHVCRDCGWKWWSRDKRRGVPCPKCPSRRTIVVTQR